MNSADSSHNKSDRGAVLKWYRRGILHAIGMGIVGGNALARSVTATDESDDETPEREATEYAGDGSIESASELATAIATEEFLNVVTEVNYVGKKAQAEVFSESQSLLGFPRDGDSYGVISTGQAENAPGESADFLSMFFNTAPGAELLNPTGGQAFETAYIEFVLDLPADETALTFEYKFATEEIPTFVGTGFQDFFTAELVSDGTREIVSELPDGSAVTVDNAAAFTDDSSGVAFNAVTSLISNSLDVSDIEGKVKLKLGVADVGDRAFDSAVFIDGVGFDDQKSLPEGVSVPSPLTIDNLDAGGGVEVDVGAVASTNWQFDGIESLFLEFFGVRSAGMDVVPSFEGGEVVDGFPDTGTAGEQYTSTIAFELAGTPVDVERTVRIDEAETALTIVYTVTNTGETALSGTELYQYCDFDIGTDNSETEDGSTTPEYEDDRGRYVTESDVIAVSDTDANLDLTVGFGANESSKAHHIAEYPTLSDIRSSDLNNADVFPTSGGDDPVTALSWELGELAPGESERVTVRFGAAEDDDDLIEALQVADITLLDSRVVQTVDSTRLVSVDDNEFDLNPDVSNNQIPDPDLVADRNATTVFDFDDQRVLDSIGSAGRRRRDALFGLAPETPVTLSVTRRGAGKSETRQATVSAEVLRVAARRGTLLKELALKSTGSARRPIAEFEDTQVQLVDDGQYLIGHVIELTAAPNTPVRVTRGGNVEFETETNADGKATIPTRELSGVAFYDVTVGQSGSEPDYTFELGVYPTFEVPESLSEVAVTVSTDAQRVADESLVLNDRDFTVSTTKTFKVGVLPIEGGYGEFGSETEYDSRREAYESEVRKMLTYMQRVYPTARLVAYIQGPSRAKTNTARGGGLFDPDLLRNELLLDARQARTLLDERLEQEGGFSTDSSPKYGRLQVVENAEYRSLDSVEDNDDILITTPSEGGFDFTMGVVPNGGLPDEAGKHFAFTSGEKRALNPDLQVQVSAAALIECGFTFSDINNTAAHEGGHHLISEPYDGDLSSAGDGDLIENGLDAHANDDLLSTAYELEDGGFTVVAEQDPLMQATAEANGDSILDALAYQEMIDNNFAPDPPEKN